MSQTNMIVGVIFPNNSTVYSYYSAIPLEVDDYAIVSSPNGEDRYASGPFGRVSDFMSPELRGYPTVVKVVSITPTLRQLSKAAKWIIQKIDIQEYVDRLNKEEQIAVLKHKIEKAKKSALEDAQLMALASVNDELAGLVDELFALTGVKQPVNEQPVPVRAHKRAVRKPVAPKLIRKAPVKARATRKDKGVKRGPKK